MNRRALLLEQVAVGDAPAPADLTATERAEIDRLREANAAFLRAHPPERVVPAIRTIAERARGSLRARRLLLLAPVAAAVLFFLVRGAPLDGDRDKGGRPQLLVYARAPTGARLLSTGAQVAPLSVIQLAYVAGGAAHGVIVSIDAMGRVTLHQPSSILDATALAPEREVRLPHAFELDDTPGEERFFLVTSKAPLDARVVVAAAEVAARGSERARLPLPDELQQTAFVLSKAVALDAGSSETPPGGPE